MEYSLGLYEKAIPVGKSFAEMFGIAKMNGFDRLEISIDETDWRLERLEWSPEKQRELGNLSRAMETPLLTMCLSGHRKYPFGSHDEKIRERSADIMKKAVEFSANTGIRIIQLAGYDVYYEESDEGTRERFAENLQKAAVYAAEAGVVLAFETMETPFMDTVEKSMYYVNKTASSWLQVYPDIGNLKNAAVLYGTDVTEDLKTGTGHIAAAHLKETKPGVYRDMNFGTGGHTEYDRCLDVLLRMGVRIFTGEFWYQKGQDYEKVIRDSSEFLRDKIDSAARRLNL